MQSPLLCKHNHISCYVLMLFLHATMSHNSFPIGFFSSLPYLQRFNMPGWEVTELFLHFEIIDTHMGTQRDGFPFANGLTPSAQGAAEREITPAMMSVFSVCWLDRLCLCWSCCTVIHIILLKPLYVPDILPHILVVWRVKLGCLFDFKNVVCYFDFFFKRSRGTFHRLQIATVVTI